MGTHVITGRYLFDKIISYHGNLLHNILPDTRHIAEEEEGEKTGRSTEGCSCYATVGKNQNQCRARRVGGESIQSGNMSSIPSVEMGWGFVPRKVMGQYRGYHDFSMS